MLQIRTSGERLIEVLRKTCNRCAKEFNLEMHNKNVLDNFCRDFGESDFREQWFSIYESYVLILCTKDNIRVKINKEFSTASTEIRFRYEDSSYTVDPDYVEYYRGDSDEGVISKHDRFWTVFEEEMNRTYQKEQERQNKQSYTSGRVRASEDDEYERSIQIAGKRLRYLFKKEK